MPVTFGGEILTCVVGMLGLWALFAVLIIAVAVIEDWLEEG